MSNEHCRYFIELQVNNAMPVSRGRENELRREEAAQFIAETGDWLRREAMESKVASMAITALGQVQIICEAAVIGRLRHHDETRIAAIRHGAACMETMGRWA